jgi:hypothetical protein
MVRFIFIAWIIASNLFTGFAFGQTTVAHAPVATSTQKQAIAWVDSITSIEPSIHWPNIKPKLFLENLRLNVHDQLSPYPGRATNFCGYGALTYLMLQDDPLGYAKLLVTLYKEGKATYSNVYFAPSTEVKLAAGTFHFTGVLDLHPAEQLWYLSLADRFKGYLNIFNRRYDAGDENTFWAAVNYAKFNKMVRRLLDYDVIARGSDIIRPSVGNTYDYISEKLKTGIIVLYLNNRILHKKSLEKIKLAVPTHFVILKEISKVDDLITLVYWDYGHRTLLQLDAQFLRKIIFGISYCSKRIKR